MQNKKFDSNFIQWYDGMPLSVHHFQQNDQLYQSLLSHTLYYSNPFCYGVIDLIIDESELLNGIISIKEINVITKNRYVINFKADENRALKLNLKGKCSDNEFFIYLCLKNNNMVYQEKLNEYQYFSIKSDHIVDFNNEADEASIFRLAPAIYLSDVAMDSRLTLLKCNLHGNNINLCKYDSPAPRFKLCKHSQDAVNDIISITIEIIRHSYLRNEMKNKDNYAQYGTILQKGLYYLQSVLHEEAQPYQVWQAIVKLYIQIFDIVEANQFDVALLHYNHDDIYRSFLIVINAIKQKIDLINKFYSNNFNKFENKNNMFLGKCDTCKTVNLILYFIEQSDYKKWIDSVIITSQLNFESIINKRIIGFERKIVNVKSIGSFIVINMSVSSPILFDSIILFNPIEENSAPNTIYLEE